MKTFTAARAKTNFGEFLDASQREPVIVTKNNRPVGVLFSMQDIEDREWARLALKAHMDGYVGTEKSEKFLKDLLNAED
jgi:prevent-host-death family protein